MATRTFRIQKFVISTSNTAALVIGSVAATGPALADELFDCDESVGVITLTARVTHNIA